MATPNFYLQDFLGILEDLKYLQRLNRQEFWELIISMTVRGDEIEVRSL